MSISTDAGEAIWAETARLHRFWAGVAFATSDLASTSVAAAMSLPSQMWRMVYDLAAYCLDVTVGLVWPYLAKEHDDLCNLRFLGGVGRSHGCHRCRGEVHVDDMHGIEPCIWCCSAGMRYTY